MSENATQQLSLTAFDSSQNRGRNLPSMAQAFSDPPNPTTSQPPTSESADTFIRQNMPNIQPPKEKFGERNLSHK